MIFFREVLQYMLTWYLGLMATYGLPGTLPVHNSIDTRCDNPVYPGVCSAFLTSNKHDHVSKNRDETREPLLRSYPIIELRDAMWFQIPAVCIILVCCTHNRRGGKLRNSDMIW